MKLSIAQFFRRFPNDDACLEHVMRVRFGIERVCEMCHGQQRFARIPGRRIYRCTGCNAQISPCAGSVFSHGKSSLHDWFYVVCVMPDEITVRALAAHLGVGFNTAMRMKQQVRNVAVGDLDGLIRAVPARRKATTTSD